MEEIIKTLNLLSLLVMFAGAIWWAVTLGRRKSVRRPVIVMAGSVGLLIFGLVAVNLGSAANDSPPSTSESNQQRADRPTSLSTVVTKSAAPALTKNPPASPLSENKGRPSPVASLPTPIEIFIAAQESGDTLMDGGWDFDDAFVQEVVTTVESDVSGEFGEWTVLNSDIVVICDIYQRLGAARQSGNDLTTGEFGDILQEIGLKRSALMGATLAGVRDDSGAIADFCAPIAAYNVGFVAAFDVTAGFYEGDLSDELIATQSAAAINEVSRDDLRKDGKDSTYAEGFLAGANAANEVFSKDGSEESSGKVPVSERSSTTEVIDDTSTGNMPKPFGDGIWQIGEDIEHGTYAAPGGEHCSWNTLSGFTGTVSDIVRLTHPGRPIVTIGTSSRGFALVGFQSFGCGQWRPITDIDTPVSSVTDGTWLVGREIVPGTYTASSPQTCHWSRLRGFNGDAGDVISSSDDIPDWTTVAIEYTDTGFMSFGCGGWKRDE